MSDKLVFMIIAIKPFDNRLVGLCIWGKFRYLPCNFSYTITRSPHSGACDIFPTYRVLVYKWEEYLICKSCSKNLHSLDTRDAHAHVRSIHWVGK